MALDDLDNDELDIDIDADDESGNEEDSMLTAGDVLTAPSVEEVVSPEKVTVEALLPVVKFLVSLLSTNEAANAKELFPILR